MKCKKCGKEFKSSRKNKKYCSGTCQKGYNSSKRYYKIRNTKKFKEARKKYFKKWIKKNRAHFNELLREPNKLRQRKLRDYRRKNKLCLYCENKRTKGYSSCEKCRIKRRMWKKEDGKKRNESKNNALNG